MQASEAGRPCEAPPGASPGPRGHPVSCLSSDADDEDEHHCVTAAEASEARAAKAAAAAAAAARRFGGPDHPEPLYMPGDLAFRLLSHPSAKPGALASLQCASRLASA